MECRPNEDCKYYPACYTDVHHKMWPRSRYKSGVERKFRELPENKEVMCRNEHNELHATVRPPKRPSRQIMLAALQGSGIEKPTEQTPAFLPYDDMGAYMTGQE